MNKLRHLAEFQKILAHYHVSESSQKILNHVELVLLLAPSGGGRNTIIKKLLGTGRYYFVVSDTTRQPRINDGLLETNGREYWFRSEEEFLGDLKQGKYLEAEILHNQQVSGISIRELEKAIDSKKVAITDIDIGGIHNILEAKKDTIAILLLPPSFDEWQRRIHSRGSIDPDEYKRRMLTAMTIFEQGLVSDQLIFVINENIDQTADYIDAVIKLNKLDADEQAKARTLIKRLHDQTQIHLQKLWGKSL